MTNIPGDEGVLQPGRLIPLEQVFHRLRQEKQQDQSDKQGQSTKYFLCHQVSKLLLNTFLLILKILKEKFMEKKSEKKLKKNNKIDSNNLFC